MGGSTEVEIEMARIILKVKRVMATDVQGLCCEQVEIVTPVEWARQRSDWKVTGGTPSSRVASGVCLGHPLHEQREAYRRRSMDGLD